MKKKKLKKKWKETEAQLRSVQFERDILNKQIREKNNLLCDFYERYHESHLPTDIQTVIQSAEFRNLVLAGQQISANRDFHKELVRNLMTGVRECIPKEES